MAVKMDRERLNVFSTALTKMYLSNGSIYSHSSIVHFFLFGMPLLF